MRYKIIAFIDFFRRSLPYFFKNIWTYRKTLWSSRPWDSTMLYLAMRDSLAGMEESQRLYGHHLNNELCCKRMRIMVTLLDRLIEDDYYISQHNYISQPYDENKTFFENMGTFVPKNSEQPAGMETYYKVKKQDMALLAKYLERYSQSFWD